MRWFQLFITIIYLSVLFSPPVKAVTASRVDVISGGIASQQAIMPLSQHLASGQPEFNDGPDDLALCSKTNLHIVSTCHTVPVFVATEQPVSRAIAAQPRAPPSHH